MQNQRTGYSSNYGNRGKSHDQEQEPDYTIKNPINEKWITEEADSQLVGYAERAGKEMVSAKLTNSQIRRIYGEIKRIQMGTYEKNKSSFFLLKPKVAYAYGQSNNRGMKIFKDIFDKASSYVRDDKSYDNFCNFMEAILAYHKANGGNNE